MNQKRPTTIRVRYGIYPVLIIALIGLTGALPLPFVGSIVIAAMTLFLLVALSFRPFLLIDGDDIRYGSLISDQIFTPISKEELLIKLPSMRWFLRKSDLSLMLTCLN
jgi:hypothetical protein